MNNAAEAVPLTRGQANRLYFPVFNVKQYGAAGNGTTDDYTAVFAAITAAQLVGGTVYFPAGTYRINSQIVIPNDGASPVPAQRPLLFVGDGALFNGRGGAIYGGTILDLRYSGSGAKIESRGLGLLEMTGITFTDLGTSNNPFFFISNTSIMPHDLSVVGNPTKANGTCDQDAFVLGGVTAGLYDGSANGSFQGYGTVIQGVYFGRIRRGVYLRCSANAVVIQNNTWWSTCGAPSTDYAAIEFAPTAPQACIGNVVSNNLFEMVGYYYGILAAGSSNNSFIANNFYDPTTVVAYYRFEATAQFNLIIAGYNDDTKPLMSDVNATNTVINPHQSQSTIFPQPVSFTNASGVSFTTPIRAKGSPAIEVQYPSSIADSYIVFRALRSAAEASNPGTRIMEMQQNGALYIGGASPSISFLDQAGTSKVTFTSSGKDWAANGSGGAMSQNSGSGGSYMTLQNFGVKIVSHTGAEQLRLGAGIDGIVFGSLLDTNLKRSSADVLKTDDRFWAAAGLVTNTGVTGSRPASPQAGQMYFDTTLTKPVWYTGSVWVDATGATV